MLRNLTPWKPEMCSLVSMGDIARRSLPADEAGAASRTPKLLSSSPIFLWLPPSLPLEPLPLGPVRPTTRPGVQPIAPPTPKHGGVPEPPPRRPEESEARRDPSLSGEAPHWVQTVAASEMQMAGSVRDFAAA